MNNNSKCLLRVAALGVLMMATQWTRGLTYDEAIDGDFPMSAFDVITLDLDTGTNTILGTVTAAHTDPLVDFDRFRFSVPDGAQVTSIWFSAAADPSDAGTFFAFELWLIDLAWADIDLPAYGSTIFPNTLPLSPGVYEFFFNGLGVYYPAEEYEIDAHYTFQINVAPIPLPAATWLLLSGLLSLRVLRHRKS